MSNQRQIGIAYNLYANTYDGWLVPRLTFPPSGGNVKWFEHLISEGFAGDDNLDLVTDPGGGQKSTIWWCPDDRRTGGFSGTVSYGISRMIAYYQQDDPNLYGYYRLVDMTQPSEGAIVADVVNLNGGVRDYSTGDFEFAAYASGPDKIDKRHNGDSNAAIVFGDGHVETRTERQIPTWSNDAKTVPYAKFWFGRRVDPIKGTN